jgi:hypothetical protein
LRVRAPSSSLNINSPEFEMGLAGWGGPSVVSARADAIIRTERFRPGPTSRSHSVTLPITITITTTADDHFRADTPGGPVEACSLRELGDLLRDFLANLEDESASDLVELARLSGSATDQATLLELARTSPPPDAWFCDD